MSKVTVERIWRLAIVSSAFLFAAAHFMQPASAKIAGWALTQSNYEHGIIESKFTHMGVRLDTDTFTILIVAPHYEISVYNNRNKRYFVDYASRHDELQLDRQQECVPLKTTTIKGLLVTSYVTREIKSKRPLFDFTTTAKSLSLPESMLRACRKYIALREIPPGTGLPIKIIKHGDNGIDFSYMDTHSITPTQFDPDTFKPPKGYKRVTDLVALRADPNIRLDDSDVADMFKDSSSAKAATKAAQHASPGKAAAPK